MAAHFVLEYRNNVFSFAVTEGSSQQVIDDLQAVLELDLKKSLQKV
jgi:hypothetical protein